MNGPRQPIPTALLALLTVCQGADGETGGPSPIERIPARRSGPVSRPDIPKLAAERKPTSAVPTEEHGGAGEEVRVQELSPLTGKAAGSQRIGLQDAIARGLQANRGLMDSHDQARSAGFSIASSEAEFELKVLPRARIGATGASSAGVEEDLSTGVTLERKLRSGTSLSLGPQLSRTGAHFGAAVSTELTQPLLRGRGREYNLSGLRSAEFSGRSAARSLYVTRVETVVATVTAVYEVVRQREFVRLNEESARHLRGHAEATKAKERIGLASPIDTYRALIQLKQAEDALATGNEAYQDAFDSLKLILALPLDQRIEVDAPLTYDLARMTERQVIRTALAERVDLDQALDAVREAQRRARVAHHGTRPELNVVLGYTRLGSDGDFGRSLSFDDDAYTISLTSNTDIARTAEKAAYQQSLLTARTTQRNLSFQRDQVARQAKRELRSLRRSEKRISNQQDQIRQAEGKLKLAQVKFQHGLANNFDLVEAETELRRARINLVSAVLGYIVGTYRLRAAMGTLLERPDTF